MKGLMMNKFISGVVVGAIGMLVLIAFDVVQVERQKGLAMVVDVNKKKE